MMYADSTVPRKKIKREGADRRLLDRRRYRHGRQALEGIGNQPSSRYGQSVQSVRAEYAGLLAVVEAERFDSVGSGCCGIERTGDNGKTYHRAKC